MIVNYNKCKVNNGVTLINYADELFTQAQKQNTKTALKIGGVKKVISFSPNDIDESFYSKNKSILEQKRGGGYWLWKPYIIKKALENIEYGEYLFYCDSGSIFINSINLLISSFDESFDIMPFELQKIEKHWTKRDCFNLIGCEEQKIIESKQIQATFILFKKTKFSIKFVENWLKFAQDPRLITDIDNQLGLPNFDGFIENRHDQSIFSLLIKKNNIKVYRDPSQYGINFVELYSDSHYPQILVSTRQRNISFFKKMKKILKSVLFVKYIHSFIKHKSSSKNEL